MSDRVSGREEVMSSPQTAVSSVHSLPQGAVIGSTATLTAIQPQPINHSAPAQPSSTSVSNSPEPLPASGIQDLKLIYLNKESDLKSPTSISLGNGVPSKVVQLPPGSTPAGGFAYVRTIIKQGKDVSEGQKVLLTPVLKEGGRLFLPRAGCTTQVRPNMVSNSTAATGQIILTQGQQPRRSFVFHNSTLSSKELKGGKDGGGAIIPKALPLPTKVPIVMSSRPHDVTVTLVKSQRDESVTLARTSIDISSLISPIKDTTNNSLKPELPNPNPTAEANLQSSEGDEVEFVGESSDMPRPIVKKSVFKSPAPPRELEPPKSPIPVLDSPDEKEETLDSPSSLVEPVDWTSPSADKTSKDQSEEKPKELHSNPEKTEAGEDEIIESCENESLVQNNVKAVKVPKSAAAPPCKLFVSSQQPVSNEALKKLKEELPGIKRASSNGHFVRILSACSGTEARELAGKHALLLKTDGKAVMLGAIPKEQQQGDKAAIKPNEPDELVSCVTPVENRVQKTFPLYVASKQESKNSSETSAKQEESPKPNFNGRGVTSIGGNIHMKEGLQVKELSKEGVMLERSRKRKGAPLLRECFRKTIAVKRLEPLPGAAAIQPLQVIDWDMKTLVGTLPGSEIKFVVNSYGALQVFEGEGAKLPPPKHTGGVEVVYTPESTGKDDFRLCIECECYGLLVEFIEEKFCSVSCRERHQTRKALITKRSLALTKETNKKRRLFEIALNKTRPTDENDNNNKMKPPDTKIVKPITISTTLLTKDKSSFNPSDSSNNDASSAEAVTQKASVTTSTPTLIELMKAPPKIPPIRDPLKEEPAAVKPGPPEERKSQRERRVSVDTNSRLAPSSSEAGGDKGEVDVFDWCEYLGQMRSQPAWVRLFKDAFPTQANMFRVGHRLEAVDPQRPSLFCAVSVTQVKGYRIKLHFDGYSKVHDFWLNADSPNIFPCGFCLSHGIELEPPWGFNRQTFNWSQYLTNIKARPAPPKCFAHKLVDSGEPNLFKVGMKLEAVDKKNSFLVCVATVAAVVDHRILIHFDSWDDSYDYWTEYYSPNIHPVGWCQRNNYLLTPPNGQKRKNFSWRRYLVETGADAAPDSAFMVRPPIKFKKGTKLEAVDPRAPHLLRVATIKQVLPYQVNVVFDGFPDHFGFWFDDDSPDLHPVGWSTRTGHPLTPPPKPNGIRRCSTPGCMGDGNASTGELENHSNVTDCPYSTDNLEEESLLPDRLSPRKSWCNNSSKNQQNIDLKKEVAPIQRSTRRAKESTDAVENERKSSSAILSPPISSTDAPLGVESSAPTASSTPAPPSNTATPVSNIAPPASSTLAPASGTPAPASSTPAPASSTPAPASSTPAPASCIPPPPSTSPPLTPVTIKTEPPDDIPEPLTPLTPSSTLNDQNAFLSECNKEDILKAACDKFVSKSLSMVTSSTEVDAQDLLDWDSRKVTAFVESLLHRATNAFYNNKVDGEGLLMLSEDDLARRLSFSKTEATTLYANIKTLRGKFDLLLD